MPFRFPPSQSTSDREAGLQRTRGCGSATGHRPQFLGAVFDAWRGLPTAQRWRIGGFAAYLGVMALVFMQPLTHLMRYANTTRGGVSSHIPLVPFIVACLLYIEW